MKRLFKQTKVEYDAHMQEYNVYYKNWLFWRFEQTYKVGTHLTDKDAKEFAVTRAKNMLDTVEIYRSPSPIYHI